MLAICDVEVHPTTATPQGVPGESSRTRKLVVGNIRMVVAIAQSVFDRNGFQYITREQWEQVLLRSGFPSDSLRDILPSLVQKELLSETDQRYTKAGRWDQWKAVLREY